MSELTQEKLKGLFHYDPETGIFTRKFSHARHKAGMQAGYEMTDGYHVIGINRKYHMIHRLAWLYMYGEFPDGFIDHINGERDDNRICNLRIVTPRENCENLKLPTIASTTGYLGVMFDKRRNKYIAKIQVNYKQIHLGEFNEPEVAYEAYLAAKRKYHSGCTI